MNYSASKRSIDTVAAVEASEKHPNRGPWSIDDIDFDAIDVAKVRGDEDLFFVLTCASLVESGSDLYTSVLTEYFGNSEVGRWLSEHWEPEELQHGRVLRLYVEHVWPEFNWGTTYRNFIQEYSKFCLLSELEPSPTLELVARCVVEAGTAVLYRALEGYSTEPVLKKIAGNIRRDEVRHYQYFYRFFRQYNQRSRYGRFSVLKALIRRLAELKTEDSDCAMRHVFSQCYSGNVNSAQFRTISRRARRLVTRNMTSEMMVKMFLQPLQLPGLLRNSVEKPCARMVRLFLAS